MTEGVERFKKIYVKLPDAERKLTIVVIDGKDIDWNQAYKEIEGETELGEKIIEKLINQDII